MINKKNVIDCIKTFGAFDDGFDVQYSRIIDFSIKSIGELLKRKSDADDERVEFLAAARAFYIISSVGRETDNVTSFSAGDVSITEKADGTDLAKNILKEAMAAAHSLIHDGGFAFIGV